MATYNGSMANDEFDGGVENDTARGNGGDDTLKGNGGDDILIGGTGADLLEGGDGYDQVYSYAAPGIYQTPVFGAPILFPVLDQFTEVDTLRGGGGDDILSAGYGDNIDGGDGNDRLLISFQGGSAGVTVDFNLTSQIVGGGLIQNIESVAWVEGSKYDDVITDSGSPYGGTSASIFGKGGNDTLVAGYYTSALYGGDGNDLIDGRGSYYANLLDGGAGSDTIYTNSNGFAHISGGDGNDKIYGSGDISGGRGNDQIFLSSSYYGADVHGDEGDDQLFAAVSGNPYPLNQVLYGDAGNDTLTGGTGNDLFDGGSGNDRIIGGADGGPNPYYGGATADIAFYSGKSTDYRLTDNPVTHVITMTDLRDGSPDGTDLLSGVELLHFADGLYLAGNVVAGIGLGVTDLVGGDGDDVFIGNEDNNSAIGNGGNDRLSGGGGDDVLEGGGGIDVISGGTGNDRIYSAGTLGTYSLPYTNDAYIAPVLDTGTEADAVAGGDGDDTLSAGYGDAVDGGTGFDTLFASFQGATAGVSLDFRLTSQTVGGAMIQNVENVAWIEGSNFDDVIADGTGGPYGSFGALFGMDGNDTLTAGYYTGSLFGGEGNDTLDGRSSQYLFVMDGGAGNDLLYSGYGTFSTAAGGEGNDTIYAFGIALGGAGDDKLIASSSYASLHGNDGNDQLTASNYGSYSTLYGDAGNDSLFGGDGQDSLDGGIGNDILFAGGGDDVLTGGAGDDVLTGGAGFDTATYDGASAGVAVDLNRTGAQQTGGDGRDRLFSIEALVGSSFADVLTGNKDENTLRGGEGDDRLVGGGGADILAGGSGSDVFAFTKASESPVVPIGGDRILDFSGAGAGGDHIDLSAIDANGRGKDGNQAFTFIGAAAFSHARGELHFVALGNDTVVEGDINGDGVADFMVSLQGVLDLTAADFWL